MARSKIDVVAPADQDYNGTLNDPASAWTSSAISDEETALSDATLGISARVLIATGNYVKVKWFYNNKPLATFKSRDYVQSEALAFLEEVKNDYDVWSTFGLDSLTAVSLAIDPATDLAPAATAQLTVTADLVTVADADVTSDSTFESSDTDVATVDETGLVTAVADGTATITARYRDESDTVTVTVATA
jgi:hypothetical protein